MSRGVWIAVIGALLIVGLPLGCGDEVRYFEQNGVTYRETRRDVDAQTVGNPTRAAPAGFAWQQRQPTAPQPSATPTQEMIHTYWAPVTEYRWEPYWVNRWNPFAEPYLAYRYVGRTRWEQRSETVRVPVATRQDLVAGRVPAGGSRLPAPPQTVVSRVAVGGQNGSVLALPSPPTDDSPQFTAHREQFGGIGRIGDEPPR